MIIKEAIVLATSSLVLAGCAGGAADDARFVTETFRAGEQYLETTAATDEDGVTYYFEVGDGHAVASASASGDARSDQLGHVLDQATPDLLLAAAIELNDAASSPDAPGAELYAELADIVSDRLQSEIDVIAFQKPKPMDPVRFNLCNRHCVVDSGYGILACGDYCKCRVYNDDKSHKTCAKKAGQDPDSPNPWPQSKPTIDLEPVEFPVLTGW